jgi:[CysO sulfur-carrier protein]-S-L-cysteine hydrolase
MLIILSQLAEAIAAQARDDHPLETCGVIAGPDGSDLPLRLIPMRNAAKSTSSFQFDADEQLRVWKEMEARGEEPIVLYHSHPQSRAYPSRDDVAFAAEPQAHYVIIATDPAHEREVRSFRIIDGEITEEKLKSVHRYVGQSDGQKYSPKHRSPICQLP